LSREIEAELVENFLVIWDTEKGSELFEHGFYGKPLGIPKPKSSEFDVPLVLDLMEGLYLAEKGLIHVIEGKDKTKVNLKTLRNRAQKAFDSFDLMFAVYRDLRDQGLVVTPGVKFGCDFAVYKEGPGIDHAPYMVSVRSQRDELTATEIVKAGRLATTVRKRFIIAVPDLEKNKTQYFIYKWFKA